MNMENAPETADASQNRAISQEPKKPTAWIAAAVILPLAFFSWFLLGSRTLGPFWVPGVTVLGIATCLLPIIICGLKEKFAFVAISLIGVVLFNRVQILFDAAFALAVVGAVRIAKPTSEWARRYYGPKKMAEALTRFALPKEKSDNSQKQKDTGLPSATTRRRTGWIIAGTIAGLILLVPVLIFVGGFISGLTSGHQRVANGKQVNNAPSANADNPGNLALPDDRCDKALLQGAEKLNATLPRQLDQYSRLDTVLAGHRRMTFFYTIFGLHSGDYTKAQVDEHLDAHQERVKQSYKTMPQLDVYRQNHVEMVYIYKDEGGNYLGQRSIKLD